jgi:hypothetical protein
VEEVALADLLASGHLGGADLDRADLDRAVVVSGTR